MFGLEGLRSSKSSWLTLAKMATGQLCFPSLSVNGLPCGTKVCEFQSFPSQVREDWPLPFQKHLLRPLLHAADVSVHVNGAQAMVFVCLLMYTLVTEERLHLADCTTGNANQPALLHKKIWSSLNLGGQRSLWLPSVAARAKQQRNCKVCVLKPWRNNWLTPADSFS